MNDFWAGFEKQAISFSIKPDSLKQVNDVLGKNILLGRRAAGNTLRQGEAILGRQRVAFKSEAYKVLGDAIGQAEGALNRTIAQGKMVASGASKEFGTELEKGLASGAKNLGDNIYGSLTQGGAAATAGLKAGLTSAADHALNEAVNNGATIGGNVAGGFLDRLKKEYSHKRALIGAGAATGTTGAMGLAWGLGKGLGNRITAGKEEQKTAGFEKKAIFGFSAAEKAQKAKEHSDSFTTGLSVIGDIPDYPVPKKIRDSWQAEAMATPRSHKGNVKSHYVEGHNFGANKFDAWLETPEGDKWNAEQAKKFRKRIGV